MKTKEKALDQYLYHDDADEDKIDKFLEETAPLIGCIIQRFNTLEKILDSELCFIMNDRTDQFGLIIINKMSYAAKIDLLERFSTQFQLDFNVKIPVFIKIIESLREVGRLRNAVAHSDWESTDFDGYTYKNLKINSKGMIQEYVQFTPESLRKIISEITLTNNLFEEYENERHNAFIRK
jgi:hypothetical protein